MNISVIIVTYNCKVFVDYCIQSLLIALKNIESEIIVIDNNSNDQTAEFLKSRHENLIIIENEINLGFSKANNKASKLAKGDYLFFLNPDTIVPENIFEIFLKEHTKYKGIYGCRMIDGRGNFLKESKRNFPTIFNIIKKLFGFGHGYYSNLKQDAYGQVSVLSGANMLINKKIFNKIGCFNEDYFMYGEDIEICLKSYKNGYENYYIGNIALIHFKGESTVVDSKYYKNFYGAMAIYFKNVYSSNRILLSIIDAIANFMITLNKFKFDRKTNHSYNKTLLLSNNEILKLNNYFGNIILKQSVDKSFNNCNVIFDPNFLTFNEIIENVNFLNKQKNINFYFLSTDFQYLIEASKMNKKGKIVFL